MRNPGAGTEVAMFRYKKVIGLALHARTLPTQKTEAKIACKVINTMTSLGHAGVPPGRLTVVGKGEIRLLPHFCTKVKDARITLERIRQVMPVFQGDGDQKGNPSSRRLWTALREIDRYLTSQSAWLINYAERHRAGLRVGTSLTEGTTNFLVNRRMNKSQQMRWSRRGADLLLQVRCAGFNGKFESTFGQLFQIVDPASELTMAA
jgi:hypothetical protein